MVWTYTCGIGNNHGIDLNSWYNIGTPESHTYQRAECCLYVGFLLNFRNRNKIDLLLLWAVIGGGVGYQVWQEFCCVWFELANY